MTNTTQAYLDEMVNLPGILSISIVNALDGLTVAYKSHNDSIDNQLAGSYQVELVKHALEGTQYVHGLNVSTFNEIIVNNEEQTHIIFPAHDNQLIIHIVADHHVANLGLIEPIHKAHASKI